VDTSSPGTGIPKSLKLSERISSASILHLHKGRRSIGTENGFMGLSPAGTQLGGLICLFSGGSVPFVLRKDGPDHFVLMGECYVDGMMSGNGVLFWHMLGLEGINDKVSPPRWGRKVDGWTVLDTLMACRGCSKRSPAFD
jgi:hypothetical protein